MRRKLLALLFVVGIGGSASAAPPEEPTAAQAAPAATKPDCSFVIEADTGVGCAVVRFPNLPPRHLYGEGGGTFASEIDGIKAQWAKMQPGKPYADILPATHESFIKAGDCKTGAYYCVFYKKEITVSNK